MSMTLEDGSRVGIIGGGPAGSFFAYFLLTFAQRMDLELGVDIYEPRDFTKPGPGGCNMCGGIVSESLVQMVAVEGIDLPPSVVQRGIDSYVLHTDQASVRIDTPLHEKRIAAVHRGGGPRDIEEVKWGGLDGYLLALAQKLGAKVVRARVSDVGWDDGRPQVRLGETAQTYDLLVGAAGVNSAGWDLFEKLGFPDRRPKTTKAYITELKLGSEAITQHFGNSMHIFLLNMPRLDCAAIIPKGEFLTVCLLGEDIDRELINAFFGSATVRRTFPASWDPAEGACHCSSKISLREAARPFIDRVVLVGDCGVTRLYKDGIGAAYRTAKAAARTAVFSGLSTRDFEKHYWPIYRSIAREQPLRLADLCRSSPDQGLAAAGPWRVEDGSEGTDASGRGQAHEHRAVGHVHRQHSLPGHLLANPGPSLSGAFRVGQRAGGGQREMLEEERPHPQPER